jgi:hypothetical protein
MIGNGSCSSGLKQTYAAQISQRGLCVGHDYSISIWLAIIGIEFSISGTLILPRLHALVVSKILTRKLLNGDVKLSTILNSQSTAPILTQARYGLRRLFIWRVLILLVVAAASVSYKFSFVATNGYGSILESSTVFGLGDRNIANSWIFPEVLLGVTGSYDAAGGQSMMRIEEELVIMEDIAPTEPLDWYSDQASTQPRSVTWWMVISASAILTSTHEARSTMLLYHYQQSRKNLHPCLRGLQIRGLSKPSRYPPRQTEVYWYFQATDHRLGVLGHIRSSSAQSFATDMSHGTHWAARLKCGIQQISPAGTNHSTSPSGIHRTFTE